MQKADLKFQKTFANVCMNRLQLPYDERSVGWLLIL